MKWQHLQLQSIPGVCRIVYVTDHKFSASGREDVDVQMLGIGESIVVACVLKFTHVCVFILRRALDVSVQTPTCYLLICSDVQ